MITDKTYIHRNNKDRKEILHLYFADTLVVERTYLAEYVELVVCICLFQKI